MISKFRREALSDYGVVHSSLYTGKGLRMNHVCKIVFSRICIYFLTPALRYLNKAQSYLDKVLLLLTLSVR